MRVRGNSSAAGSRHQGKVVQQKKQRLEQGPRAPHGLMASRGHADAWLDHTGTTSALAVSIVVRLTWYQLVVDRYPEYGLGFEGCLWQMTSR
jgi:hypothetical protein